MIKTQIHIQSGSKLYIEKEAHIHTKFQPANLKYLDHKINNSERKTECGSWFV